MENVRHMSCVGVWKISFKHCELIFLEIKFIIFLQTLFGEYLNMLYEIFLKFQLLPLKLQPYSLFRQYIAQCVPYVVVYGIYNINIIYKLLSMKNAPTYFYVFNG